MTQEEKELLIKDLCARLPYGVKGKTLGSRICTLTYIGKDGSFTADVYHGWIESNQFIPYLRPMSSITIEELDSCVCSSGINDVPFPKFEGSEKEIETQRKDHCIKMFLSDANVIDWLNAHHFDYRGLIEKGLALEAPDGIYN